MMNRILIIAIACIGWAIPANADKLSLDEISAYLNEIQTAKARFLQLNDDGSRTSGTVMIRRPGRIRFDYDPPNESLVMAGQGEVAIFDAVSNEPPQRFPLIQTPLYIILEKTVDLKKARMVVAHRYDGTNTIVVAQDPDHPDYGSISLVFSDEPVALRQWVINGAGGGQTAVLLQDMELGMRIHLSTFNIREEMKRRSVD